MIRSGMRPPSPKTGTGFSAAICSGSSWKGFWITQGSSPCCRTSISKLYRKAAGREAKLCYMGHAVMENRNAVDGTVTQASGTAERRASEAILKKKTKRS